MTVAKQIFNTLTEYIQVKHAEQIRIWLHPIPFMCNTVFLVRAHAQATSSLWHTAGCGTPLSGFFMFSPTWWWSWHRYFMMISSFTILTGCTHAKEKSFLLCCSFMRGLSTSTAFILSALEPLRLSLCVVLAHTVQFLWIQTHLTV